MPRRSKSPHNLPLKERFETFFVKGASDECWPWLGCRTNDGHGGRYGAMRVGGRMIRAHRLSQMLYKGSIPTDLQVLHSCDNPTCVNPGHLSVGTNKENSHQAWRRDRKRNVRKLSPEEVVAIRSSAASQASLAKRHNVAQGHISRLRAGVRGDGILLTGVGE